MRGGTDDVIRTGHTFSDEPGVYIEDKVSRVFDDQKYPKVFTNVISAHLSPRLACVLKTVFISLKPGLRCTLHRMWGDRPNHRGSHDR